MRLGKIFSGIGMRTALSLIVIALLFTGCFRVPTQDEMKQEREKNARQNVKDILPPDHIVFEQPLSLEALIKIALENNLELRIQKLSQDVQSKESLTRKLEMLPGLEADARWTKRDKLRKSDVYNWELDEDQKDYTVSELKDGTKANLALTWNVLDTILAHVRATQSEIKELVLDQQFKREAHRIALEVTEAYWQAAALEDALDYVHTVEKKLKDIKRKIDASVGKGDIDSMVAADSELRLKELELTIRQLQANLSTSRLRLSQLLGFNQNVQYTLERPPIKPVVTALPHTKELDIDRLEEHALLNRPELFETDLQVLVQKQEAKTAMLRLFPGLDFFAALHYDDNRLLYSNTWNSIGAGIAWNLLRIPATIAYLKGTEHAVEMAEANRLMMTVGVITEVHIALLDYAIKVDRFRLLEDTYTLSANLLNMAAQKYSAGRISELAVTQRHLEEMAAKLRRDEAVVEMLVAHKRLCVSIGLEPLNCDILGNVPGSSSGGSKISYSSPSDEGLSSDTSSKSGSLGAGTYGTSGLDSGGTSAGEKKWKCTECGYIHVGAAPPNKCPVCGADKSKFVEFFGDELENWGKSEPISLDRGPASPGIAGRASDMFLWKVQIGAFTDHGGAAKRIDDIRSADVRMVDPRDIDVETARVSGITKPVNRVRFKGLTQADARAIAGELKQNGMEYWLIPPKSAYW